MSRVRAQPRSARDGRGRHRHAPRPPRPRRGDAAAAEPPVRAPDQAGRRVVRRGARSRRPDRARRHRVPRPDGDRRQPVLEVGPRRAHASPPRDPPPQPRGESGDGDHPRAARPARSGRPRQAALQRVPGDRPGVRAEAKTRRRHAGPLGNQHLYLRSLRRLRGDQPRLPRDRRGRRGRLDGWRGHAPILSATRGGRARLAARQRSDPPGAVLMGGTMQKPLVLVALVLAVVALAFGSPGEAQRGPLKIGLVTSETGILAANGKDMINGLQLFLEEQGGKLAGREVKLIIEDDEGKPATGLTKARSLVEGQGIHVLIGPVSAAIGYAIAPYVDQKKIPTLYPIVSADDITQRKRSAWIVRSGWASSQPSHPFGKWVYDNLGYRKIAMIGYDFAFGWEVAAGFQRTFEEAGGQVLQKLWPPLGTADFAPYITRLRRDVDAIYAVFSGAVENGEKFSAALRRVDLSDAARGPVRFDDFGNPVENIYVRKVERVGGRLQNTIIHTFPSVSQFWTYKPEEFLKNPAYSRDYPPCKHCQ